ncbi:MAG: hypothetical protein GY940_43760 [bacterium]|nr:hypothetical protein [bacterium]
MKKKKSIKTKKLVVNKTTITNMTPDQLIKIKGGTFDEYMTRRPKCISPS